MIQKLSKSSSNRKTQRRKKGGKAKTKNLAAVFDTSDETNEKKNSEEGAKVGNSYPQLLCLFTHGLVTQESPVWRRRN